MDQSRQIYEALSANGVSGNAVLIGHSLGGPVVARMAADYPDFVKGLVLVAPGISPVLRVLRRKLCAFFCMDWFRAGLGMPARDASL